MASYEDLKKKAKDALDTIADVSAEAYRAAEEKARILARRAKLNAEITREKAVIRRIKGEIGSKYYELHKDDAEEELKEGCDGITASLENIEAKKAELEELKNTNANSEKEACDCDDDCCAEGDEAPEPAEEAPAATEEAPAAKNPKHRPRKWRLPLTRRQISAPRSKPVIYSSKHS